VTLERRLALAAFWLIGILFTPAVRAQEREGPIEVHHVHGLAIDRDDPEIILVATHTGLVRFRPRVRPEWVGEHRFDLMGFTADSNDAKSYYASGHPDVGTYAREAVGNLGLLVSRDGGRTWQSVALKGHADFHALTYSPGGSRLYGWNVAGQAGLYRISTKTWTVERLRAEGLTGVLALSASPDESGVLLAGAMHGLSISRDGGQVWRSVDALPAGAPVTAVSYHLTDPRLIYAYVHAPGKGLMRSSDGGTAWEPTGFSSGPKTPVIALAVGPKDHVVVATTGSDLLRSYDGGRSWKKVLEQGRTGAGGR